MLTPIQQYQAEQQALEQQRKDEAIKDSDFIRVLAEMIGGASDESHGQT